MFDLKETSRILSHIASSTLVTVDLEGDKHLALVREKQRDFIKGTLKHVDFQVISMKEKLRVHIAIELVGESYAVKNLNGVLVSGLDELEVECLPKDLPEKIVVDVSSLKAIGDTIYVRDVLVSDKFEVLDDPGEVIAVITGQQAEEVVEVVEVVEAIEPEVIEKGKKEEEEEEEA
jgi:large subunit ribosomal protein L25